MAIKPAKKGLSLKSGENGLLYGEVNQQYCWNVYFKNNSLSYSDHFGDLMKSMDLFEYKWYIGEYFSIT